MTGTTRTELTTLRANLAAKHASLANARDRGGQADAKPEAALRSWMADREIVIFCGAGISIPAPSSAPAFLDLRNSVVLALTDLLTERGVLDLADRDAIDVAMHELETQADLSVPPELVFENIRDSLGFDVVSALLRDSLYRGTPNANHRAIRTLVLASGPRVSGIITPNFDLYLERALEGIQVRRTIGHGTPVGDGLPLFKPHGSLDHPSSLAVTFDTITRPLKGPARQTFHDLTAGRAVMVLGYSGWDYDLLPLLIYAGREWGTDIAWLLHEERSFNERVAMAQLALGSRLTLIDTRRQPVLANLAGLEHARDGEQHEPLRQRFRRTMEDHRNDRLIAALIDLIIPAGVPESNGVAEKLGSSLLHLAASGEIGDDEILLHRLGTAAAWTTGEDERRAAQLALAAARRLNRVAAIDAWERTVAGEDDGAQTAASRLRRIERDLRDFPRGFAFDDDPEPDRAANMMRASLRIEHATLLVQLHRDREAETLARQILCDTTFPSSGVSEDAWIIDDAMSVWELHSVLGTVAGHAGNLQEMESRFCQALDVLWGEMAFFDLAEALTKVAFAARKLDAQCAAAALDLAVQLARFSRDRHSELVALEWKANYGYTEPAELDHAQQLLDGISVTTEEREKHTRLLRRLRR